LAGRTGLQGLAHIGAKALWAMPRRNELARRSGEILKQDLNVTGTGFA